MILKLFKKREKYRLTFHGRIFIIFTLLLLRWCKDVG